MSIITSNDNGDQFREVSSAVAELRQAIVVSVLKRKYGFDIELDGVAVVESESLDDCAARLLALYRRPTDETPRSPKPLGGPTEQGETSPASKSIWKRVLRFLTFGAYR